MKRKLRGSLTIATENTHLSQHMCVALSIEDAMCCFYDLQCMPVVVQLNHLYSLVALVSFVEPVLNVCSKRL